ncbi:hypothetical protein KsCSTR_46340 [Candidatus Kuenenia stuttgartiensis]|uniref:Uncharacterized protein n=1 Tax=Kuenenia stuttgartiensis TaxID=174633 RepID=Q1PW97_KUEST|nr:hypothetical protein KsCSTR_46340 [Candidatus Kuenenia stuttgartiensis]CAJ71508.1 unknown protein [Candidatus Kuenenia stuttgartiensis]
MVTPRLISVAFVIQFSIRIHLSWHNHNQTITKTVLNPQSAICRLTTVDCRLQK